MKNPKLYYVFSYIYKHKSIHPFMWSLFQNQSASEMIFFFFLDR